MVFSWVMVSVLVFCSSSLVATLIVVESATLLFFLAMFCWGGSSVIWCFLLVVVGVVSIVLGVYVWCVYEGGVQMVWFCSL